MAKKLDKALSALSAVNKVMTGALAGKGKTKARKTAPRPAKVKGEKKPPKLKVYKKSKVLAKILDDNPDMVESVQDLRSEKKGYRVNLHPCWKYQEDGSPPEHFVSFEGLTDVLYAMQSVEPCDCAKCQASMKWSRPATYTKSTRIRCKTTGDYIILTQKQWDDRPMEWVRLEDIEAHSALQWVDHNKEDAVKINKLLGDDVFYVAV